MHADRTSPEHPRRPFWPFLAVITAILAGWALHATAVFMVPVTFSLFLALIVAPLDRRVAQRVPGRFA